MNRQWVNFISKWSLIHTNDAPWKYFEFWPPVFFMLTFSGLDLSYAPPTPTGGFSYCWWYDMISFDETIKILVVLILFIMCYKCAGSFPWRVYRLDVEIWLWCKFLPRADATLPPIRELPSFTISANESSCIDGVFRNIKSVARPGMPFLYTCDDILIYTCPRKICCVTDEIFLPKLPAIMGLFNYCSETVEDGAHRCGSLRCVAMLSADINLYLYFHLYPYLYLYLYLYFY